MEERKITRKDLWKSWWRYWWSAEMSNSYERLQGIAFCFAMIPIIRKLYPNDAEYKEGLVRHMQFFNTEGLIGGPICLGVTIAMEEERALTGAVPEESITTMKTALMGPFAGIGDSLTWGTVAPIISGLACGVAATGSIGGWFILWLFPIITSIYAWFLMKTSYNLGSKSIGSMIASGWFNRILTGGSILGLIMVGALAAGYVSLSTTLTFVANGAETSLQGIFDSIMPGLLPLGVVWGVYFYYKKFGQKYVRLIIGILVASCILAAIGIV